MLGGCLTSLKGTIRDKLWATILAQLYFYSVWWNFLPLIWNYIRRSSKNIKNSGNVLLKNRFHCYLCGMFTEQQEKWLKRVEELFFKLGIKSITMDDVARELGISKKTLYSFVESKDDLVSKVMDRHMASQCQADENLHAASTDA